MIKYKRHLDIIRDTEDIAPAVRTQNQYMIHSIITNISNSYTGNLQLVKVKYYIVYWTTVI